MWKCFQIRTLYLKKATRSQYTGGIFDEVKKSSQSMIIHHFFKCKNLMASNEITMQI